MFLMPLPNRKFAEIKRGFTLYNLDGEALRRYPAAKITLGTAVARDMTYYVEALTWPKVKYVLLKNMNGKQLLKKLTGENILPAVMTARGLSRFTQKKGKWSIGSRIF